MRVRRSGRRALVIHVVEVNESSNEKGLRFGASRRSRVGAPPTGATVERALVEFMAKNGPKSWSKAKLRQKRPQTNEAKRSHEQVVGRLPRQTVSRPEEPPSQQGAIRKKPHAERSRDEKRLRSLNKLLRDIEALQKRQSDGEDLDEQQLAKLARLDGVLDEMESLMDG